ncbi:MAG: family 1 glycosylhydrolase [Terrimicrobiaceae bacterium]
MASGVSQGRGDCPQPQEGRPHPEFVWTLVDNHEWHHGYKAPFGMAKFARDSKKRLLRPSALFYRGLIDGSRASGLLDDVSTAPELSPGFIER